MNKVTSSKVPARTLIYIPIIHTEADMGTLGESLRRAMLQKLDKRGWNRKVNLIDKMWTEIEQVIDSLAFSYKRVRLYQDGLPVCGREAEIVTELAKTGSRNHQLLLRLIEKGATIMGTESSELLVEEYKLIKQLLAAGDSLETPKVKITQKALEDLLKRRDQYISDRINRTLCVGKTGILFLGMLHSLENQLNKDIRVIYPINRPFSRGEKENEIGRQGLDS